MRSLWNIIKQTYVLWGREHTGLLAAGLSYFTVFALGPLLIITIAVCGQVFGERAATGQIVKTLQGFVNPEFARALENFIHNAHKAGLGKATSVSVLLLFFAASGMFFHLRRALNLAWSVDARGGVRRVLLDRLFSFLAVLGASVFILVFFLLEAGLGTLKNTLGHLLPVLSHVGLWKTANFGISIGAFTFFIVLIYRFLPSVRMEWKDACVGSAVTAFLMTLATSLAGLFFSHFNFKSVYGVAASVVVTFLWVYISAHAFLFGAKFTWVFANSRRIP